MRHWSILAAIAFALGVNAQEFTVHPNGLIYDEATMGQLGYIVDSLNQRFQACTVGRSFRSVHQAAAIIVRPAGADPGLEKALSERISVEDMRQRFGVDGEIDTVYLAFFADTEDGDSVTDVLRMDLGEGIDQFFQLKEKFSSVMARAESDWFYERLVYYEHDNWRAVRLLEPPVPKPLPARYARMVEYVDCLVDTTGRVMVLDEEDPYTAKAIGPAVKRWYEFVKTRTREPDCEPWREGKRDKACTKKWDHWRGERDLVLDSLRADAELLEPLRAAYAEVLDQGRGSEELENAVGRYLGHKEQLELMRRRMVIGGCSMDAAPRDHAREIAVLAAETTSWPVFLRAHLDIMNDRFHRVTDGSYAWGQRETYLRELEELHIDVPDLVVGSCLRISDPPSGHYFGSIGRVGRALAETREPDVLEERMLGMIQDPELDLLNRVAVWYLYLNYCGNLKDQDDGQAQREQVLAAAASFPAPLARTVPKKD